MNFKIAQGEEIRESDCVTIEPETGLLIKMVNHRMRPLFIAGEDLTGPCVYRAIGSSILFNTDKLNKA